MTRVLILTETDLRKIVQLDNDAVGRPSCGWI